MKTLIRQFVLLIFCLLVFGNQSFTQVLIAPEDGTPDPSAVLEIRSETGGLLIPNIELTKVGYDAVATNIPAPADGLMIFHDGFKADGDASGLPKGLWYYDDYGNGTGKWVIYSRVGSIYSSSLDNFGEMYEIHDMGNGTSITLHSAYSIPWKDALPGFLGPGFMILNDEIVPTGSGPSLPAEQLKISSPDGYYTADVSTTIITNTSGNIVTGQLFVNNVAKESIFFRHAFQTSGEYVNCSTSGIIQLNANDKIDFRFKSSTTGEVIFVEHLNLKLTKIGDL